MLKTVPTPPATWLGHRTLHQTLLICFTRILLDQTIRVARQANFSTPQTNLATPKGTNTTLAALSLGGVLPATLPPHQPATLIFDEQSRSTKQPPAPRPQRSFAARLLPSAQVAFAAQPATSSLAKVAAFASVQQPPRVRAA